MRSAPSWLGRLAPLLLVLLQPAVAIAGGPPDGGVPAGPPDAAVPADYDSATCLKCHGKLVDQPTSHTPAKDDCKGCHTQAAKAGKCKSPVSSGWQLTTPDPDLCLGCHDVRGKTPMHPPIEGGGCVTCHDPHGSPNPSLLVKYPIVDLCNDCHTPKGTKKSVHTAVKKGNCTGCHSPHAGEAAPLLIAPREKLCLECHKPDKLTKHANKHVPVAEGRCLDCHDAHESDLPANTLAAGKDLCLKCHDAKARQGLDRPGRGKRVDLSKANVHGPVGSGDCQDCHVKGHDSKNLRLLETAPPMLCWGCHPRNDETPWVHTAVRAGDCAVCHDPHSEGRDHYLRDATAKEMCFRCHTDDVTGRAFIHKPVAEGKCDECHDPHGSENRFNLKQGSGVRACAPCHAAKVAPVKVKHLALERSGCTACHDPHATANRYQLIKPANTLCQSCHTDKMDGLHVSNFVRGGHKIAGGCDPHDVDKDFSCVSCHDAHGSNSPMMLRFGESPAESCDWCHGDHTGKHPEPKDISGRKRPKPGVSAAPPLAPGDKSTQAGTHAPGSVSSGGQPSFPAPHADSRPEPSHGGPPGAPRGTALSPR